MVPAVAPAQHLYWVQAACLDQSSVGGGCERIQGYQVLLYDRMWCGHAVWQLPVQPSTCQKGDQLQVNHIY